MAAARKKRIYDIAKEYNISSDALLKVLRGLGFQIKSHMSVATEDMLEAIAQKFKHEIEEVKKDVEARERKRKELEAKKRREAAEKAALRRKEEAEKKRQKALEAKKAREKAARELEKVKAKEKAEKKETGEAEKEKGEKKRIAIEAAEEEREAVQEMTEATAQRATAKKRKEVAVPGPARADVSAKAEHKAEVTEEGKDVRIEDSKLFGEELPRLRLIKDAPTEEERQKQREEEKAKEEKKPKTRRRRQSDAAAAFSRVTAAPDGSIKMGRKFRSDEETKEVLRAARQGAEAERGEPRKRRRKKKKEQKVDKEAVRTSFKQTMASLDSSRKTKKYKKRAAADEGEAGEVTTSIEVTEFMTVAELAKLLEVKPAELVAKCMELGMMASINQRLDMDTIETLALEYDVNVNPIEEVGTDALEEEKEENLQLRSPVVTIMGHVDHGKTTLLDYIRESNIVSKEAGKITQHIGAYEVDLEGGHITFLDTPGHEAFSAMRARGAQVTDIVILVVSAVESVMPQTIEAINHARAANVPIVVAINKMDLPNANPDSVRQQLANHNLLDEAWGGKTTMVEVSAKSGVGIDKLLEMVLLQAEIMELKADPTIRAQGVVIESKLEKGRGPVATVLIQKGTMEIGQPIVAGAFFGRVRAMVSDISENVKKAGPSQPVQITGLNGVPQAGDTLMAVHDETEGRDIALKRQQIKREYDMRRAGTPTTLESVYEKIKEGQISDLKIIIKADVAGSVEVLNDTLGSLGNEEIRVNIIHTGIGSINESDVLLAAASHAIIVGFHVTADARARETAQHEEVDIRLYSVIYDVQEDITKAIEGMLEPELVEEWVGTAEVRDVFKVPKIGNICGSYVQQGAIQRGMPVRLSRNGVVIYDGTIDSLKRFKEDVKEVKAGLECGIGLAGYNDIQVGDQLESYRMVETARKLT